MDQAYVYATGAVILGLIGLRVWRRGFDPFAPVWLFLIGYAQVYVIQALSYRDYALRVRGPDVVADANARAFWALLWFLVVYGSGIGKWLAKRLPAAPRNWSIGWVSFVSPILILWGLLCAGMLVSLGRTVGDEVYISAGQHLLLQFPSMQLVAGVLLIVTGRRPQRPRPWMTWLGLATAASYTMIWMYYGRRSHSLFGVLALIAAYYLPRFKRPSLATLSMTAFVGCLVVALALGWRGYRNRHEERGWDDFGQFAAEFDLSRILISLNLKEHPKLEHLATREATSHETDEYGGYLLMLDTVPQRASYDYGSPYIRLISTYIPRIIWHDKPFYGREKWVAAWIAGSEFERDESFTGPAISILGAAQLNGGAIGTVIVLGVVAIVIRTGYDYFRFHADCPWAQAWWAVTYFNAWLMTVNDNPAIWFYYLYGHAIFPPLAFLWIVHRAAGRGSSARGGVHG